MAEEDMPDDDPQVTPVGGAFQLHGPLTESERKEQERQRQEEERHTEDLAFKRRQLSISEGQLTTNKKLALYTFLLVFLGLAGNAVSFIAANVARQSADAAKKAADTAASALRLDQRAWIVVRYPTIPLNDGAPIVVPLTMENIGKTVAKHVRGDIAVYILKAGEDPDLNYGPGHTHYSFGPTGSFIPNTPDVMNWIAIREGKEIVLTPITHTEVVDGRSLITIHGRIEYQDIFGVAHWLTFCQETGGGVPRASGCDKCATYNDNDAN